jgi:hypothetical protein
MRLGEVRDGGKWVCGDQSVLVEAAIMGYVLYAVSRKTGLTFSNLRNLQVGDFVEQILI